RVALGHRAQSSRPGAAGYSRERGESVPYKPVRSATSQRIPWADVPVIMRGMVFKVRDVWLDRFCGFLGEKKPRGGREAISRLEFRRGQIPLSTFLFGGTVLTLPSWQGPCERVFFVTERRMPMATKEKCGK